MNLKRKIGFFLKDILPHPKRLINLLLLNLSRKLKLTKILAYPLTIMVEPTNICNLKCPLCPTGAGLIKREKGFMTFDNFKKIIDETGDYIIHLRLWNWGEPLLNKDVFKMISYAKRKKVFINLSTNSNFLNKEIVEELIKSGLDELIVSIDGASEETYNKYRKGGDFNKIIDSLRFLIKEKRKLKKRFPYIRLQFIIMKHNEHEIPKIKSLVKEIDIDELAFKTVGIMDYSNKEDIKKYLPTNKRYSRYVLKENQVLSKKELNNSCDFLWNEMIINWDGSVVPCCFDMNNRYVLGNVFSQKIRNIWNNPKYVNFRKNILKDKKAIDFCKNCPGTNKETFVEV